MNSGKIAVTLAVLVVAAGVAYAFVRSDAKPVDADPNEVSGPASPEPKTADVLHVDDIAQDPDKFSGPIRLQAVVSGVNKKEQVITVIDVREFERCNSVSCCEIHLPVKIAGTLPSVRSKIHITARIVEGEKGLILEAESVEPSP